MAPHTEKSQLISKPAARRGGSKSPSKVTTENGEMPQQPEVPATPRKVSDELSPFLVPSRKVSAPELGRPTVTRGGRRNLFVERCISQEEKENIKSKPPMRKFSTPAISTTLVTDKTDNKNNVEIPSKCGTKQVKSNETLKVEAPKPVLEVPSAKIKEKCHIATPQSQQNVSKPKGQTPINTENKETCLITQVTEEPPRKISAPEFHICPEGSTISSNGGRKLYTERCVSVEEQQNIKSKPVVKKRPKKSVTTEKATTNQDVDQSKDINVSANSSSKKLELKEKVVLKPKSAQRKLSAPAKMMTPAPNPSINGHDLLSNGIVLDGRGHGMTFDNSASSIREEDGKPSFAKAAKVIHAKVQVVSCFRSSGSMPIPRIPKPSFSMPPPPKPRKLELPSTHEAKEIILDVQIENVGEMPDFDCSSLEELAIESKIPRLTRCLIIPRPKIISVTSFKGISEDVILRNRGPKIPRPPPPPSEYVLNSCTKHSRCHCNLLSKEVDDFFSVTPQ